MSETLPTNGIPSTHFIATGAPSLSFTIANGLWRMHPPSSTFRLTSVKSELGNGVPPSKYAPDQGVNVESTSIFILISFGVVATPYTPRHEHGAALRSSRKIETLINKGADSLIDLLTYYIDPPPHRISSPRNLLVQTVLIWYNPCYV